MSIHLITAVLLGATSTFVPVKVDGDGYLRFVRDGRAVFAKEARLVVAGGRLTSESGLPVMPTVSIGGQPSALSVDLQGNVRATLSGNSVLAGRLVLAVFEPGAALSHQDGFLVSQVRPKLVNPGDDTAGVIRTVGVRVIGQDPVPVAVAPKIQPPVVKPAPKQPTTTKPPKRAPGIALISVRPTTEVESTQFTLAEIAEVDADPGVLARLLAAPVGDTPPLGVERQIDASRIAARLRMAGFEPSTFSLNVPAGAKVLRRGNRITHESLVARATEAANAKLGEYGQLASKAPGPDMIVALGQVELIAEEVTETDQSVRTLISVYVDGKRVNSRAVVLERLGVPAALRLGQTVRIRVRSSGATIETTGRVSRTAKRNQLVEVMTSDGVTLNGTPKEDGLVEVQA